MINHSYAISLSALCFLSLAVSCQDEELGYTADQIAYRTNFEKAFGKISDVPTWDFSSYNLARLGLQGGPGAMGTTRAGGFTNPGYTGRTDATPAQNNNYILASSQNPTGLGAEAMTNDGYYNVESGTRNWLDTNLPESALNVTKGQSFVLGKPTDNFAIIPIYQGHSGMGWNLHLVDKGTNKDYTIWSKSTGIRYKVDFNEGVQIDVRNSDITEYQANEYDKFEIVKFDNKYFEDYDGTSDIEITIDMPAWRYLKGKFENRYGDSGWTMGKEDGMDIGDAGYEYDEEHNVSYYTFDNRSSSERKSYTIKLSEQQKNWVKEKGIQFVVTNNINQWTDPETNVTHYEKCYFKYYAQDRVIASVKYNKTKWINLEGELTNEAGHTVARSEVQAKPIVIDQSKITGDFYLYLEITQEDPDNPGESGFGSLGSCQRSDEHMMVALPCAKPGNIGSNEYMIIGCEDSNTEMSDWDVNDIVFLCVGQGSLPKVQEVVAAKRYMIEDLGSTFDFDFNDIVVDVTQYRYKNYLGKYQDASGNYTIEASNVASAKTFTKATLKHLCGTIPFQIKIGNTILGTGKYDGCNNGCEPEGDGCDPTTHGDKYKAAFDCVIDGWNPNSNNITVTTWPKQAGTTGWNDENKDNYLGTHPEGQSFSFPSAGKYPYIIATDQSVMWMKENVNVPSNWFTTWPTEYPNNPGIHNQGTDPTPEPTVSQLSLENLGAGWGEATYNSSTKTIHFVTEWTGKGWWFSEEGDDKSAYNNVIVKLASAVSFTTKVVVEYNAKEGENWITSSAVVEGNKGYTTITVPLNSELKDKVRQIYVQAGADNVDVVLSEAYLTSATE